MDEPLQKIWIRGYRSIVDVRLELGGVTVVTGPNGVGKTNLYRGIQMLAATTRTDFLRTVALEGGMGSMKWAGPPRKKGPVRLEFGVAWPDLSAELKFGYPSPTGEPVNAFQGDPEVKEECLWPTHATQRSWLYRRRAQVVSSIGDGEPIDLPGFVKPWEVGLGTVRDPAIFPEVEVVRNRMATWRFYHQFRSDADSPLRRPSIGFRSPILESDGSNLPAALQTIAQIGNEQLLADAIARVFEGGRLVIDWDRPEFELSIHIPSLRRPLSVAELSDGQLRFLCLTAALLSPRPPELFVLNEPETSLHHDTLDTLADLIARASVDAQILVTTHSERLRDALVDEVHANVVELERDAGATRIVGQHPLLG